jgi:hypothetical protein
LERDSKNETPITPRSLKSSDQRMILRVVCLALAVALAYSTPCDALGANLTGKFCWAGTVIVCQGGNLTDAAMVCPGLTCYQGECVSRCFTLGLNLTGNFCWADSTFVLECLSGSDGNLSGCPGGCWAGKCRAPAPLIPFWTTGTGMLIITLGCTLLLAVIGFGGSMGIACLHRCHREREARDYIRIYPDGDPRASGKYPPINSSESSQRSEDVEEI